MAYGENRTEVVSDTFDTEISTEWDDGYADWATAVFFAGGHINPTSLSTNAGMRRNTGTYTADHYSRVTAQTTGASKELGACVRMHPSSTTDESCYIGSMSDFGTDLYIIYETTTALGFGTLASAAWGGAPTAAGDIFTAEAEGTTIRMGSAEGGADTQRVTTTDATLGGATYSTVGLYLYCESNVADGRITAWSGGSIGVAAGGIGRLVGGSLVNGLLVGVLAR